MGDQYTLPSAVRSQFEKLCELQPLDYIPSVREHVKNAIAHLHSYSDEFLGPDIKLADQIADRCSLLLTHYPKCNDAQKKIIIGAVRYFIVHMDSLPDSTPLVGLDDDALVISYVLEQLGMEDQAVKQHRS